MRSVRYRHLISIPMLALATTAGAQSSDDGLVDLPDPMRERLFGRRLDDPALHQDEGATTRSSDDAITRDRGPRIDAQDDNVVCFLPHMASARTASSMSAFECTF